jgi:hypothetical protein
MQQCINEKIKMIDKKILLYYTCCCNHYVERYRTPLQ